MQYHDETLSPSSVSPSAASVELLVTPMTAPISLISSDSMDVGTAEASHGVRDLDIADEDGAQDDDANMSDAANEKEDEDEDADSDYDFDEDLDAFDEEDDNDDIGPDERVHYLESLKSEIDEYTEEELVTNMRAQRDRLTGEDAAWVDNFLREQEAWKQQNNGKSVDDYSNIVKLRKFIPQTLTPARPVRAVRK